MDADIDGPVGLVPMGRYRRPRRAGADGSVRLFGTARGRALNASILPARSAPLDKRCARQHCRFVLSIGDTAPDFEATDQKGQRVKLDELLKESAVVLYFYPKDFTPVCTAQACLFRDATTELESAGVRVVGVSGDAQSTHTRFAETHRVPYSLLSDPDKSIQKSYEARQLLGLLAKRVTYVIDRQKKIRGVFHHELSAQKHVDAVKKVLASMGPA